MTYATSIRVRVLAILIYVCMLVSESMQDKSSFFQDIKRSDESINPDKKTTQTDEVSRYSLTQQRRRAVRGARTLEGSIYEGLRPDYLVSVTLPWTIGMFALILLLLICMRTDGWLYHLFTDDYVPPAVKKRLEEEARRAEGRKVRMERVDNWDETNKTWETDLKDVTERVKSTMPVNVPSTAH